MIEVVAGILIQEGKVLIARRASHKSMPSKWEFPGGKMEQCETPEEALERELLEEFGVITQTGKYIGTNIHDYGSFQIKLLAYTVEWITGEFILIDHDEIAWVGLDELQNYDLAEADIPIIEHLYF